MFLIQIRMLYQNLKMDVTGLAVKLDVQVLLVRWDQVVPPELMVEKVHKVFVVFRVFKVNLEILEFLINLLESRAHQVAQVLLVLQVYQVKLDDQDLLANLAKEEFLE